jgi:hypothetical protein
MANIIEEFYYGNIEPQELNSELAHELKIKLSKLADKEEKLTALLNGEEKELFLDYAKSCTEFTSISNADSFITGFRLGARFTYDMFLGNAKG